MTIQLAPTMIIEKDVDTMEKDFFKVGFQSNNDLIANIINN